MALAEACALACVAQPLVYLFVGKADGCIKYIGMSTNLPSRLKSHLRGRLASSHVPRGDVATTLTAAGEQLHLAMHACELALFSILCPAENRNRPGEGNSMMYRCVSMRPGGPTEVVTYDVGLCRHLHADALYLEGAGNKASSAACDRPVGAVLSDGAGLLETSDRWNTTFFHNSRAGQASAATQLLTMRSSDYRVGRCELIDSYVYYRCKVPCALKWTLMGEPPSRRSGGPAGNRALTEHHVQPTDDDDVQLWAAEALGAGGGACRRTLTRMIMGRRATLFYGDEHHAPPEQPAWYAHVNRAASRKPERITAEPPPPTLPPLQQTRLRPVPAPPTPLPVAQPAPKPTSKPHKPPKPKPPTATVASVACQQRIKALRLSTERNKAALKKITLAFQTSKA